MQLNREHHAIVGAATYYYAVSHKWRHKPNPAFSHEMQNRGYLPVFLLGNK